MIEKKNNNKNIVSRLKTTVSCLFDRIYLTLDLVCDVMANVYAMQIGSYSQVFTSKPPRRSMVCPDEFQNIPCCDYWFM